MPWSLKRPRLMRKLWEQLAIATNWPVLVAVAILSALGVLTIWVTDKPAGMKQLTFLGVSFICMMLFQAVNYQTIGRWSWPFYFFSMMLVAYTLVAQKVPLPFVHE